MSDRVIHLLEFDKIRERLADQTAFSASRELALGLWPSNNLVEAERRQQASDDARNLLRLKPSFSIGGASDIRSAVRQAELGGLVEPLTLLEIATTLGAARQARDVLTRLDDQLPMLGQIASDLVECSALEVEIGRCIGRRGEVLDSATPQLARIRLDLRQAHDLLQVRLDSFLSSSTGRNVLQEPIVTVREGRYVVPIKSDFRGQIRGIIHDTSASGATVFMEPLEVVELNNRWRELQFEEQREIERILRALSREIGDLAGSISTNVALLAEIDLYLSMARYGSKLRSVRPRLLPIDEPWLLDLRLARHPLLGGKVVPVSVQLGGDYFIMVITGPNTGGKTVALKTVGLLTLMAMSGMPVPAAEGTTIPAFRAVAADIGDEQSIEQSLSTFSAHIGNIVRILESADSATLVLLDELGAGTDPAEGSALARAVLGQLVKSSVPTIATTHSSEIKAFAHVTPGVQNASVEFDVQTLAPTYRLVVGLPGSSNALAIASRLGLAPDIVESARGLLNPSHVEIERLLGAMQEERDALSVERERLTESRVSLDRDREELGQALRGIEEERERLIEQARSEFLREADDLLRAMQRASLVASSPTDLEELGKAAADVAVARQRLARQPNDRKRTAVRPRPLRIGEPVRIRGYGQVGELLTLHSDRDEATVQVGSFTTRVSLRDIEPVSAQVAAREHRRAHLNTSPRIEVNQPLTSVQIDLRGRRVDEVYPELDRYLNDAYLSGISKIRVVHGKGTGALRQVVRDQLASHPLVSSWEPASLGDGGEGATVVLLAV